MAKLPSFRRIRTEDYAPDYKDLVEKLSVSLNNGIEVLYDALNNKITFQDNVASTVKDAQFSVDAAGIPTATTTFAITAGSRALGLLVVDVRGVNNPSAFPTSGVTASWTQSNNNIIINHITGLQANQVYNVRFIAILQ